MFLPPATSSQISGFKVQSATQSDILLGAQNFMAALAYNGGGAGTPHVRPIVTGKPWTDYAVITTARVGDYVDTQRRRRNRVRETYVSGGITYP
jgi:hypothetical protein